MGIGEQQSEDKKPKLSIENLLNNAKNPDFIIMIWKMLCILGFLTGIFFGAMFTQQYYINQVNSVFNQARDQDGCFNNFMHKNFNTSLWYVENGTSVPIEDVTDYTDKANEEYK